MAPATSLASSSPPPAPHRRNTGTQRVLLALRIPRLAHRVPDAPTAVYPQRRVFGLRRCPATAAASHAPAPPRARRPSSRNAPASARLPAVPPLSPGSHVRTLLGAHHRPVHGPRTRPLRHSPRPDHLLPASARCADSRLHASTPRSCLPLAHTAARVQQHTPHSPCAPRPPCTA